MGFALDVVGYGARTAPLRSEVQRRLPRLVRGMLGECGMSLDSVEHEWSGDGINAIMPADTDPTMAMPILIRALAAHLGADNTRNSDRIRLRMSVGIGLVEHNSTGFGGALIIEMNRLVGSAPLRSALDSHPAADLVVAISDQVHSAIIEPGYPGIPGTQFTRVDVAEKEFTGLAWVWASARQWTAPPYGPRTAGDPRSVGCYRVAARLGSGRAGHVYLCAGPDGTRLAVKVIRPEAVPDPEDRRRLAAAVRAAAPLRGPHIAPIADAGTDDVRPWIATALVPGPSLRSVITETGPLPPRSALWLAAGAARALAAIHQAGIVHRALHSGNVLLAADGPVVTDTGTGWASITAAGDTEAGEAAGDVLALGCLLFFAVTGRTPYGDGPPDSDRIPQPRDEPDLAGCPPAVLPVVRDCLLTVPDRPGMPALALRLGAMAGPRPRDWLPQAVTTRLADYLDFPPPAPPVRSVLAWRLRQRRRRE